MAITIYKSTILPIIEYADFVYDRNIKYVSKKLQTLQNQGLNVVYNQHILPYTHRESTETLHSNAKLYRLYHYRNLHLLSYAYKLSLNETLLDKRDIPTRCHVGKLFLIPKHDHYRCSQDPTFRAMCEWNLQPVDVRISNSKSIFLENWNGLYQTHIWKSCSNKYMFVHSHIISYHLHISSLMVLTISLSNEFLICTVCPTKCIV